MSLPKPSSSSSSTSTSEKSALFNNSYQTNPNFLLIRNQGPKIDDNRKSLLKTRKEIDEKFNCGVCRGILENAHRPNVCNHV